jgi:hypothetical protein
MQNIAVKIFVMRLLLIIVLDTVGTHEEFKCKVRETGHQA